MMRSAALRFTVATVAIMAFMGFASGAMALTVSPSGFVTATSINPSFGLPSIGAAFTCSTSSMSQIVMNADGTGSLAAAGLTFSGCRYSNASFTISQNSAFSISTVLLPSPVGVLLVFTVPARGLRFDSPFCGSFTVSGAIGARALGGLPLTTSTIAVALSTLRLDSGAGICAPFVGLSLTFTGMFSLNHSLTFSG